MPTAGKIDREQRLPRASSEGEPELVKMAILARRSGVPAATIKHYIREGLLPPARLRTSRNMAYYDASVVPRIRSIKELQQQHFLPLKAIKDVLDGHREAPDPERAATAIASTLRKMAPKAARARDDLIAAGVPEGELEFFKRMGLVTPVKRDGVEQYEGDDLELLRTLGAARKSGITPEMLPFTTLMPYADAVRQLVEVEVKLMREGILPRAGRRVGKILEAATTLSERLVILLRRRMILPTLQSMAASAKKKENASLREHADARRLADRPRPSRGSRAPAERVRGRAR